ncbi:hypothetical protein GCM10009689_27450 [Brevibacterium antiquum]
MGPPGTKTTKRHRIHPAWWVAAVAFLALLAAAGFRAAPFAAALMDRFGVRQIVALALILVTAGAGASVIMTASWQLLVFWGLLIAAVALVAVPVVWFVLRDHPEDRGVLPYGADPETYIPDERSTGGAAKRAFAGLAFAARHRSFWALAIAFAICGAMTNGLIGIHFIPSAHDHGMPTTTAAGLLAVVGIFDIAGTVFSGWLTDKFDPRFLLLTYYTFRGVGLLLLPWLLSDIVHPSMVLFIVIYGLDWVATVPPTSALCREVFGDRGTIVFGWVFAAHQLGAASRISVLLLASFPAPRGSRTG